MKPHSLCQVYLHHVQIMYRAPDKKKSSKEPLAPIREKLRRQIIFLGAAG